MNFLRKVKTWFCVKTAKLNRWIDKFHDSKRLLIGIVLAIVPWTILDLISNRKTNTLGFIWLLFLIAIRMWWYHGNLKIWLDPDPQEENTSADPEETQPLGKEDD
jgi:hypothetical protein